MSQSATFIERIKLKAAAAKNQATILLLKRLAEEGIDEGNCTYLIRRKKRFCANKAAAGCSDGLCFYHSQAGLAESRAQDETSRQRHECSVVINELLQRLSGTTNIDGVSGGVSRTRQRRRVSAPKRMANPFSKHLTPDLSLSWSNIYSNKEQPLHIDVGCAKGRCVEKLAQTNKSWNFLGLEIRSEIVKEAQARAEKSGICNVQFVTCNFVASAAQLLSHIPKGIVRMISFQFPDPWRRGKHAKRLIIQPSLVRVLSEYLAPGAIVYLSSDCGDIACRMKDLFLNRQASDCITGSKTVVKHDSVKREVDDDYSESMDTATSAIGPCKFELLRPDAVIDHLNALGWRIDNDAFPVQRPQQSQLSQSDRERSNQGGNEVGDGEEKEKTTDEMDGENPCWLKFNPLGEPSERELVCEVDWRRVWRCVLRRVSS